MEGGNMVLEDVDKENCPEVIVHGPCETRTCMFCQREYPSIGKYDPGYCKTCSAIYHLPESKEREPDDKG